MEKRVFAIVVTYNGATWIMKNMALLRSSSYPVEVVVFDNHSTDDTLKQLQGYPGIHLFPSSVNLGFGVANTLAIQYALREGADYVFLLNQDAWVFTDTVEKLVALAERNKKVGIVSPLHFSGDGVTLDLNFEKYYRGKTHVIPGQKAVLVPFVNAAAWLVSRSCIEKVGYFEPLFFHYGEDRNYCDRVLFHRFSIAIATDAAICHDASTARNFKKDLVQSRYRMLGQVLNVNHRLLYGYWQALRSVAGLPKYFSAVYGGGSVARLFLELVLYFFRLVFSVGVLRKARAKAAKNG